MKTAFILTMLLATSAFAAKTEVYRCNAEFLFPNEDETKIEVVTGEMVISSENGQETAMVNVGGTLIADNQAVSRQDQGKPALEMLEQINEIAAENPQYAEAVKNVYGTRVDDMIKNTKSTTFVGFEQDDMGAILGHHYDANGKLLGTEISVAWLGTGLCK